MKAGNVDLARQTSKSKINKMLLQRILTALVLVPAVLIGVLKVDTSWLAFILGIIVCLGAWEWTNFTKIKSVFLRYAYVGLIMLILIVCYYFGREAGFKWLVYFGAIWWLIATVLIIAVESGHFTMTNSTTVLLLLGLFVLIPAWQSITIIHGQNADEGPVQLIFLLLLIWTADIAAYFTGRRWGTKKLSPKISPGKTWQGTYGAIVACFILALLCGINTIKPNHIIMFLMICSLTVMVSIIGDLLESLMKRGANIKDSGKLLPGHGGVLDRIDSLTAAAPFFLAITLLTDTWA
jgi:phosphatidate cytidylyltransferase